MGFAAGFTPDPPQAGSTAAGYAAGFEPEMNADAARVGAAPTAADIGVAPEGYISPVKPGTGQPQVGAGKAFARGAVQGGTAGLFSALNSAADTAAQKLLPQAALDFVQQHGGGGEGLPVNEPHTFEERRAAYQANQDLAKQQHNLAFGAGEFAGAVAVPIPGASSVGGFVAKKLGGKLAARIAGTAVEAGLAGTAYGAGEAIGKGKDLPEVAKEAGKGALAGSITGAALHGAAGLTGTVAKKALDSLSDKYVQLFGAEVAGGVGKKATKQQWASLAAREDESGIKAAQNYIKSPELAPVEKAAAGGFYNDAVDEIDKRIQVLSPQRRANYQVIKDVEEPTAGEGLDSIRNHQFIARNSGSKGAATVEPLNLAEKQWIHDFSTADADTVQALLEKPAVKDTAVTQELAAISDRLPNEGRINRQQWLEAARDASPAAKEYLTSLESAKFGTEKDAKGLFEWDPKAKIDPLALRAEASSRAEQASSAFDALTPQFSQQRKQAVSKAINGALEKYLDRVAVKDPGAAEAVRRIRSDDVKWNVLLTAKSALKQKADKQTQDMLQRAPAQINKMHGPTLLGAGMYGANAAMRTGIRNAPRLQRALADLPPQSGLAQALTRTASYGAQQQANQPPTQPAQPVDTASFGNASNGP